jgi:Fur family peroxide stress response transcriptional regulator
MAVLTILAKSRAHPSAQEIYQQVKRDFPMTSLATVYKTITMLKEMGEVLELGFSDDSSRYDGRDPTPHPHLICVRCKKIVDWESDALANLTRQVCEQSGYKMLGHRLDLLGLCPDCQKMNLPGASDRRDQ